MEEAGDTTGKALSPKKVKALNCNAHVAHVEGWAEIIVEPDTVEILFRVESTKDKAEDARQSVAKRIDYLLQIIRNVNFKGDVLVSTNKLLSRCGEQFCLIGEVLMQCNAEQKYEDITNLIVEKLESGVVISAPHFFHSSKAVQEGRQQALRSAVNNARYKAQDMASISGQLAGRALIVEEKDCNISRVRQLPSCLQESLSKKRFIHALEIHAHILASYELLTGNKTKE